MYSFKYHVYYTSKASTEQHSAQVPGLEVRELLCPLSMTQELPCPLTMTQELPCPSVLTQDLLCPPAMTWQPPLPVPAPFPGLWLLQPWEKPPKAGRSSAPSCQEGPLVWIGTPRDQPHPSAALGSGAKLCLHGKGINWAPSGNCPL